jgi:hypothetical protein
MHTNHRIALLIRASRLYCHSLYQEYDPKYYLIIREVVLNFTNKLFDTKSIENKIDIKVLPLFEDNYIGVNIAIGFPNGSGMEFELYKQPLIPEEDYYYKPRPIPAKA